MSKVYHVTLVLELDDDVPDPETWDWAGGLVGTIPGLTNIGLVTSEQVPHANLGEDPAVATFH